MTTYNSKDSRNAEIREMDAQGVKRTEIARIFEISRQRVLQICGPKYLPGREGKHPIPYEDIPILQLQLAKCEITIEDVMAKYSVSRKYGYLLLAGYRKIRQELGLYKCRFCKKAYPKSEMTTRNTCRSCNDDMTVARYRRLRKVPKDAEPCKKCGIPVGQHHLAQYNHEKWHQRKDAK